MSWATGRTPGSRLQEAVQDHELLVEAWTSIGLPVTLCRIKRVTTKTLIHRAFQGKKALCNVVTRFTKTVLKR